MVVVVVVGVVDGVDAIVLFEDEGGNAFYGYTLLLMLLLDGLL